MRRIIWILLSIAAFSIPAHATACGSFTITGACYYIAPAGSGGSDSNNGTSSGTPWLSPNHAVNCGDLLLAAAGAYDYNNFYYAWGAVTCSAGNNVAWLACATFDACTMSITTSHGAAISASYWGIQGFGITGNSSGGPCIQMYPTAFIHHIIVADNVLVGCGQGGVAAANNGISFSEDYLAIIGNIVYGTSGGSASCTSGISIYEPIQLDSLPGTHLYVAGNFSFANVDGNPCNGGAPTDGNGLILDTFDGSQGGLTAYNQQAVAENNLLVGNGSRGFNVYENNNGSGPWAHVYVLYNTLWGNNTDPNTSTDSNLCAPLTLNTVNNVESYLNIAVGNVSTACNGGAYTLYALAIEGGSASDHIYSSVGYAVSGTATHSSSSGSFAFGPNNITGSNPSFAAPAVPSTPSCGSFASTRACMASVIANFQPSSTYAAYGIQPVSTTSIYDPLYPHWLCTVTNLPTGLVTPGCLLAGNSTGSGTGSIR